MRRGTIVVTLACALTSSPAWALARQTAAPEPSAREGDIAAAGVPAAPDAAPIEPASNLRGPTQAPPTELDATSLQLLRKAEILRAEQRFEEAEKRLLELQERAPDWSPVLFNLAVCAEGYGDLELAADRYQAFVATASGPSRTEGELRMKYLRAKLAADRPRMRTAGYAMFGVAGVGVGLALGGVALGVTGSSQLDAASRPGIPPEDREAPLQRITAGTALTWTGVAVAGIALGTAIALVVASDARAKKLSLRDIARRPRAHGLGFRF